jgi:hypothetical protein
VQDKRAACPAIACLVFFTRRARLRLVERSPEGGFKTVVVS